MDLKKHGDDIKFFNVHDLELNLADCIWGFTCLSRQNNMVGISRDTVDEVIYGVYDDKDGYGCLMEVVMAWETVHKDTVPFLRAFSESFLLLSCPTHQKIMRELAEKKDAGFTSEDFSRLLISHGFVDWSDVPLPNARR